MPRAARYLWRAFGRLSARRGSNGYGPNPLGWPDIDAFVRHSRLTLAPWEVEMIEMLDDLWLSAVAKSRAE